jgi:SAM-dependent methyltransferase
MDMIRHVEPEWLDELPAGDPRAQRSRRDLVRINALMGNARIVAGELRRGLPGGPRRIAEIGAGNGTFLAQLAGALPRGPVEAALVDRQEIVAPRTFATLAARGWKGRSFTADVFDWLEAPGEPAFDAIVANLFLHHFEPERLAAMLGLVARRTRVFVACEPRRSGVALLGARSLGVIGCNDVSRHDAVVSVRAGFSGREISALWTASAEWSLKEEARGLFSHVFVARRTR